MQCYYRKKWEKSIVATNIKGENFVSTNSHLYCNNVFSFKSYCINDLTTSFSKNT